MTVKFDHGMHTLGLPIFLKPGVSDPAWSRGTPHEIEQAGADLVDAVIRAGWDIPGVEVSIATQQTKDGRLFRRVTGIKGETDEGFYGLTFYGTEAADHGSGVSTGVSSVVVPPGIDITYFSDDSGPRLKLYNTADWKGDGDRLREVSDVNAALQKCERASISYNRRRGDEIFPTGDYRDYQPGEGEQASVRLSDVKADVVSFLKLVTARLLALPAAPLHSVQSLRGMGDPNLLQIAHVDKVAVPRGFPTLHTFIESREASEVIQFDEADKPFRIISPDRNWRLADLGSARNDLQARAFQICAADGWTRELHHTYHVEDRALPVLIELKYANDVYVADRAAFTRVREGLWEKVKAEGRQELTDKEVRDLRTAVADTMVPLIDYKGGFEEPRYLIGRQLKDDEARLIQGAITLEEADDFSRIYVTDRVTGLQVDVYTSSRPLRGRYDEARRLAEDFAFYLDGMSRQFDIISNVQKPEPRPEILSTLQR